MYFRTQNTIFAFIKYVMELRRLFSCKCKFRTSKQQLLYMNLKYLIVKKISVFYRNKVALKFLQILIKQNNN